MNAARSSSHRQILRSSSIVGGASLINIGLSLLRMKAAALVVGPAGVGLIGLLQNFLAAGSTLAGLGLGGAVTRHLAAKQPRQAAAEADVRRALFWAGLLLSLITLLVLWSFRTPLASLVLRMQAGSSTIMWLAGGISLAVIAGLQVGVLNGLRRIGDLARVNILSGLAATLVGVAALYLLGPRGILIFVLAVPAAGAALGWYYLGRLPAASGDKRRPVARQWGALLPLGLAIMLGGLLTTGGQLAVRTMVSDQLGPAALGHFHAAWTISMTYLGLVLSAMGTDYYPRLADRIGEPQVAGRLVAEQTEVALLLGAPILLAAMGAAPLIMHLLYAAEFRDAADMLRWQIMGDLLRVAAWPLGVVLLAAGRSRIHLLLEALATSMFVGGTALLLPTIGLEAVGMAFLAMYAIYLPAAAWAAHHVLGGSSHLRALRPIFWLAPALLLVMGSSWISDLAALASGSALALCCCVFAYRQLHHALPTKVTSAVAALQSRFRLSTGAK